jgi:hypothetical protein
MATNPNFIAYLQHHPLNRSDKRYGNAKTLS